jgi:hypothetical protein
MDLTVKKTVVIIIILITLIFLYYLFNVRQKIIKKEEGFSIFENTPLTSIINIVVSLGSGIMSFALFSLINPLIAVLCSVIIFFLIYIFFGRYLNNNYEGMVSNIAGISNILTTRANNTLSNYFIKASFNSAYTGYLIDVKNIDTLLKNGVRFFDFEVGLDQKTDAPIVGIISSIPNDNNTVYSIVSSNSVLLDKVLTEIITNSFSSSSPNSKDPVFIQFRINSNNTKEIYNKISTSIQFALSEKLYTDVSGNIIKVDGNTILNDILGKIIIVVDSSTLSIDEIQGSNLGKYVNIYSGTNGFVKNTFNSIKNQSFTPPSINGDGQTITSTTGGNTLIMTCPDTDFTPNILPIYNLIKNYGVNIVLFPFYNNNNETTNYNNIFNNYKTSFIPMGYAINYANKKTIE